MSLAVIACEGNSGKIGHNSCNRDRACFGNTAATKPGQCNGDPDPNTGKGVCEPERGQEENGTSAVLRHNDCME